MTPVKGKPAAVARGMRLDAAFDAVLGTNVAHLKANEAGLLSGHDPEYLHQMRVALRRLRSAMTVFAPAVPARARRRRGDLKWISKRLGAARDWDVFVTETLPRVEAGARARWPAFRGRCDGLRRRAGARAAAAVRSPRYRNLFRELAEGRVARGDAPAALRQPLVEDYASAMLDWRYRRLVRAGAKPEALSPGALHRFRVALKKFRYAAGFFAGLFEPRAARAALKRLSRLQDILGAINDAAVAQALAAAACAGASPAAREAGPAVKRWGRRRIAMLRRQLAGAWKSFRARGKFW